MRKMQSTRRNHAQNDGLGEMFRELSGLQDALACAYRRFNATTEPELVDACVYEINAAQSRYNYMLRRIKDAGGTAANGGFDGKERAAWV